MSYPPAGGTFNGVLAKRLAQDSLKELWRPWLTWYHSRLHDAPEPSLPRGYYQVQKKVLGRPRDTDNGQCWTEDIFSEL